jgi:hypothetical protein
LAPFLKCCWVSLAPAEDPRAGRAADLNELTAFLLFPEHVDRIK